MAEFEETRKPRKGWKIAVISLLALVIAGGGIGAATANSWMPDGLLAGTSASASPSAMVEPTPEPATAAIPAVISLTPAAGTEFVNPVSEIAAEVINGTVFHAVLKEAETGAVLGGELAVSNRSWKSSAPPKFDTGYTFNVTALDSDGFKSTKINTFATVPA